jgi:hypothetical protein
MSNLHLHLVDIEINSTAVPVNDVIEGTTQKLVDGAKKSGQGKVVHSFKVVGENRIVAILDGGVESAVAALNASYGNSIKLTCTPLRTYEQFGADVLKLDEYKSLPPATHYLGPPTRLYWLQFDIGFKGRTFKDFISIWAREALSDLAVRQSGKLGVNLDIYKTVAENQTQVFVNGQDEENLDDFIFARPAMEELGDEMRITTKSLVQLYSSAQK